MNKRRISIVVGLLVGGIIAIMIVDYLGKRPGKLGENPYEYNVDEYKAVDPELIHYKEVKNFPIRDYKAEAIDVEGDQIWLTGEGIIQSVSISGIQNFKKQIDGKGTCIVVSTDALYIGFEDHIAKYSKEGDLISTWEVPGNKCVFTSLALGNDVLYVADAGNRRVLRYDLNGVLLGEFEGKAESAAGHGFIVPSANFDLLVNGFGELWIVNPGKHALENYTEEGVLRGFWERSAMTIDGFTGCCNPAEIAVLNDGSFVTSEKGMVRIKVYDSSGELQSVVAAPEKFNEEGKAPEVAVDDNDLIYALDFDRSVIRVFEKNN